MNNNKQKTAAPGRWLKRGNVRLNGSVFLLLAVLTLTGVFLLASCSFGQSAPIAPEAPVAANVAPEQEFPSFVYNSARVLQAYETAIKIPEVLPFIPCYCGCGEAQDHQNLKDCFFLEDGSLNDHGAFCDICDLEVIDVAAWQAEGFTVVEIRGLIDDKYASYGEPTETPPLTRPEAPPLPTSPIAGSNGTPRIFFEVDSVDLGEVNMDIPINYTFYFKNIGDAPLTVMPLRSVALVGC